jgi:2-dehydropantoate 2-reductase
MTSADAKLLVVGPGALGLLFAARLGRRCSGVHVLDHRADRAATLQEEGIHVTGVTLSDWTPPPGRVRADVKGWPVMDAALLFVKAPAVAAAIKKASPVLGPKTLVFVFSEAADLRAIKTRAKVLPALTADRARIDGVGRVAHEAAGETFFGPGRDMEAMTTLFREALIPAVTIKGIDDERWLIRLAQTCVDVPTALVDAPQKALLQPPLLDIGEVFMSECAAVAKAMKRPVDVRRLRERRDALIAAAPEAKSPLGRDLIRGKKTERAALLEPLLLSAHATKTPTPFLSDMDRLLRRLEKEGPAS